MGGAWLGGIFVGDEGGHAVVLRALCHYRGRLRAACAPDALAGAPSMAALVSGEAARTLPLADGAAASVLRFLAGDEPASALEGRVPLVLRALESYAACAPAAEAAAARDAARRVAARWPGGGAGS